MQRNSREQGLSFHPEQERFATRRMVVKIGSSTITEDGNPLNAEFMEDIADQVATLFRSGVEVLIVSSGAVDTGKALAEINGENVDPLTRQVAAIYGQVAVTSAWKDALMRHGILAGQALYTEDQLQEGGVSRVWDVLRAALKIGVPIINTNDAASDFAVRKLNPTENDQLSSYIARKIEADTLLLLTDRDGILDESGERIPYVSRTEDVEDVIGNQGNGTGGMRSKIYAADGFRRREQSSRAIIANGRRKNVILDVARGRMDIGTLFGKPFMLY